LPDTPPILPWTTAEDHQLLKMKNVQGRLWSAISLYFNREIEVCQAHYKELTKSKLVIKRRPVVTKVRCLGPLSPTPHYWLSPDKSKFRVCPTCRAWNVAQGDRPIDIMDDVDVGMSNEPDLSMIGSISASDASIDELDAMENADQDEQLTIEPELSEDTIIAVDTFAHLLDRGISRKKENIDETLS
jgi:hypothetical protein